MINKINLLKNVGTFDYVESRPDTDFRKLTLIYGENGKGKTTLANIFRSLGSNKETSLIEERRRLGAKDRPHIVIEEEGRTLVYQDGQWKPHLPNIAVFDDNFVVQNICSGMEVSPEHRKNLHELIIGEDGAVLNRKFQMAKAKIDEHNGAIREIGAKVQSSINGKLPVDDFCKLPAHPDIENAINEAEKNINTARFSESIKRKNKFQTIELPALDIDAITAVLQKDLPALGADATNMVKNHLAKLGEDAQDWVSRGVKKITLQEDEEICPFCDQGLTDVSLINHYKDYFGSEYNNLKTEINALGIKIKSEHNKDVQELFKQTVDFMKESGVFWKEHIKISDTDSNIIEGINAVDIASAWKNASEPVLAILRKKASAPLEKIALPEEVMTAVAVYKNHRQKISGFSELLQSYNAQIITLKEKMNEVDLQELESICGTLKYTRDRYTEPTKTKCQEYLNEQEAKKLAERKKDTAKAALDAYSETIFKEYQDAINTYLDKFLAGFHLADMAVTNPGGAKSCIYTIKINNTPDSVPVNAANGEPSFKNTLSAGDRNALALAFFFASLDKDVALAEKIVVIDDPMTSLDEHRANRTVQEIRSLTTKVNQVILLSHSKSFLCQIWEEADRVIKDTPKISLHISRAHESSVIEPWNIHDDCITQNDKRHTMIAEYIEAQILDKQRDVAIALRPTLEAFMRVAYPERFPPGAFLGVFITQCRQGISNNTLILDENDISELDSLINYANKFHHDSNPNHRTEIINDIELVACCKKVLSFTRRPI